MKKNGKKTSIRRTDKTAYRPPAAASQALRKLAGRRVLITAHSLADTDAIASCLALSDFLGPLAVVAIPDRANAEARRVMAGSLSRIISFKNAREQYPFAPIVLLDCNDPSLLPQFAKKMKPFLLIDHHAVSRDSVRGTHEWIEPEAASCSELVASLIGRPSRQMARYLIWGILSDSAHLLRADADTLMTLAGLLDRTESTYEELLNALRQPESLQNRVAVLQGLRQAVWKEQEGWLLASAVVSSHESHVADALVAAGADAAFVGTSDKKGARISARLRPSLADELDLPALMGEVGRFLGGMGGGHPAAAGASGPKGERLEEALILAQRDVGKNRKALDED